MQQRATRQMQVGGRRTSVIARLFADGQQGFWLPFTDFASLSQDAAGTLPYTALEQPVGRVLDRSGRGNHATQPTSTARGVVSARVNLLRSTDAIDTTPWSGEVTGSSAAGAVVTFTGQTQVWLQVVSTAASVGVSVTYKCKLSGTGTIYLFVSRSTGGAYEFTQQIITLTATPTEYNISHTIANAGQNGFKAGIVTATDGTARSVTMTNPSLTYTAQSALPYQRVTTPTDYDAVGFPKYLRLEVDDFYTCGGGGSTTGFYYSDVVSVGQTGLVHTFFREAAGDLIRGYSVTTRSSNVFSLHVGLGVSWVQLLSTTVLTAGTNYHIAAWDDNVNIYLAINGVVEATAAKSPMVSGGSTITLGKIPEPTGGGFHRGSITEPIYRAGTPPSAYERGVIRAYQMQKAGMA